MLDTEKDKKGGNAKTHTKSREQLINVMLKILDLKWREPGRIQIHVEKKKAWDTLSASFFLLISSSLLGNVTNANTLPGTKTDQFIWRPIETPGSRLLEIHTSLLSDIEYINMIREIIKTVMHQQYKYDKSVNEILLWDTVWSYWKLEQDPLL